VRLFVPDCKLCDRSNALAHESTCARSAAGQQEAAEQFARLVQALRFAKSAEDPPGRGDIGDR
jgi:hypothetical protein